MTEVTIETIDFMPLLKQQLIIFTGVNYEGNADYSNHSLVQEYYYLERNNLLGYLHNAEYLTNELRLRLEFDTNDSYSSPLLS